MDKVLKYLAYIAALAAAAWYNVPEVVRWLMLLMALDVVTGTILAARKGDLNSSKAWIGGTKKVGTLLIIALVYVLESGLQLFPGIPVASAVTGYYVWTEALSIVTNAAALGVPIPDVLTQALSTLSPDKLKSVQPEIAPASPVGDGSTVSDMNTADPVPQNPRTMRGA